MADRRIPRAAVTVGIATAIAATAVLAALLGSPLALSLVLALHCLWMMSRLYAQSGDILDARAALFAGTFIFLAVPAALVSTQLLGVDEYFIQPLLYGLAISRADLVRALVLVSVGVAVLSMVVTLPGRASPHEAKPPGSTGVEPHPIVWVLYAVSIAALGALVSLPYGSPVTAVRAAVDPVTRLAVRGAELSGLQGIVLAGAAVSAYYVARRLRRLVAQLALFVPIALLALPAGNRGTVLTIGLLAIASARSFVSRHAMRWVMGGLVLALPIAATVLLLLRSLGAAGFDIRALALALAGGFFSESSMIAVLAYVLEALRQGAVHFTYGIDIAMYPLWYLPRFLWAGKPMPLDFRLNETLGLNGGVAFGTPVSLFGGVFLNFTPWAYVPMLAIIGLVVAYAYRHLAADRLVAVFLAVFVLDLVRVGDLSRESVTLTTFLVAVVAVRLVAFAAVRRPVPSVPEASASG